MPLLEQNIIAARREQTPAKNETTYDRVQFQIVFHQRLIIAKLLGVLASSTGWVGHKDHKGMLVPLQNELQGAAQGAAVSIVCAFWGGHAGAAAGCCLKVLLLEWHARFRNGMQGAAAGCCFAGCCCYSRVVSLQGAAAGFFFRVLLEWCVRCGSSTRVRFLGAAVRGLLASAGAGCGCRVLLSKGCPHVRERCGLWRLGAGVAAGGGCEMSTAVWALGPDGDYVCIRLLRYVYAVANKASTWLPPSAIWGLCRRTWLDAPKHRTMQFASSTFVSAGLLS